MVEVFGNLVVDVVVRISDLLREEHTPGLVSAGLLGLLAWVVCHFEFETWRRCRALDALRRVVAAAASDPVAFSDSLSQVNRTINELGTRRASSPRSLVATAWDEYSETFVQHREGDRSILCNSVRPSQFFNPEDLHFGVGFWRVWPGLFVTIGLFLTFLGLISALHAMNTAEGVSEEAMTNLLTVASAKFIMSLTGLACSIVFTAWLRFGTGRVESAIHSVNRELEQRLSFLSLEKLAAEQVEATHEQKEHFRRIGMELVEELGRPLREDLPKTISDSIGDAVSPLIAQVGELGTASVGEMVRDLSSRITTDVDDALRQASEQLGKAGDRLGALVDRMDGSSDRMGSEMEGASQRLAAALEDLRATMSAGASATSGAFSDGVEAILAAMRTTLEGIRENTADGAQAMADAAGEMRGAAERFREELAKATEEGTAAARERMNRSGDDVARVIDGAGDTVRNAIEGTGREIAAITGEVTEKAGRDLLGPMGEIAQRLDEMVEALGNGVREMRRASDGVKDGADASSDASANFRGAAGALVAASDQVKPAVERLETATQNLAVSTRQVGESARHSAATAGQVLEAAQAALGGERQAIDNTLRGLAQVLEGTRGQGDRLDDIDEKLGRAFESYRTQVAATVDALHGHVREMQEKLTPALDTMREIVEQAERFVPEQRARRAVR